MDIRLPDGDIDPVWGKMTEAEQAWYKQFKLAFDYYNKESAEALYADAGKSDLFETVWAEVLHSRYLYRQEKPFTHKKIPLADNLDHPWSRASQIKNDILFRDQRYNTETDI